MIEYQQITLQHSMIVGTLEVWDRTNGVRLTGQMPLTRHQAERVKDLLRQLTEEVQQAHPQLRLTNEKDRESTVN